MSLINWSIFTLLLYRLPRISNAGSEEKAVSGFRRTAFTSRSVSFIYPARDAFSCTGSTAIFPLNSLNSRSRSVSKKDKLFTASVPAGSNDMLLDESDKSLMLPVIRRSGLTVPFPVRRGSSDNKGSKSDRCNSPLSSRLKEGRSRSFSMMAPVMSESPILAEKKFRSMTVELTLMRFPLVYVPSAERDLNFSGN